MKRTWEIDVVNWEKISIESLKFIFDRGNEKFNALCKISDVITTRAYSLILLILAFITFSFKLLELNYYVLIFTIPFLSLLFALWKLFTLVFPRSAPIEGSDPKLFQLKTYVDDEKYDLEQQQQAVLMGQIESVQFQIDKTNKQNETRFKILKICLKIIMYSIAFTLLSAIILKVIF